MSKPTDFLTKGPSNNKCSKLSEDILDQGKAGGEALAGSKAPTTNKALVQNSKLKTSNYCLPGPKGLIRSNLRYFQMIILVFCFMFMSILINFDCVAIERVDKSVSHGVTTPSGGTSTGQANAQGNTQTTNQGGDKIHPRKATLEFEDELVEGGTEKPELFYLFQKKNFNYRRLIKLRENFIPEMKRTSEDVQKVRGGY